ncbi:squalene monooxygenase [Hamadaea sp. NPDC051192]|uniref:NAD(P)/FAD-dependent oxidoreductase n=1 Tax=Hamadaea sp. NPDC051192 TaxID=3154940 RepID=UPI00344138D2
MHPSGQSTESSPATGRAIVVGGSVAGLLAARVLAGTFDHVLVLDRDEMPLQAAHRKGVPQSRHAHGLLDKGRAILDELLPGFTADIVARGAVTADTHADVIWYNDGHRMLRAPSEMTALCVSRPTLEAYVRSRVAALPQVEIRAGVAVDGLTVADGRVTGVRTQDEILHADVVVDATGRSNRGPAWLTEHGYAAPPEDTVKAGLVYVTREYRRDPAAQDYAAIIVGHHPANPTSTGTLAAEGDRWIVTLMGVNDDIPPLDGPGFEAYAARLDGPELSRLLATAEPLTEPTRFRIGPSARRRYERCDRLPEGYLALGDSLCCFNPAYGQGMTTAAMAAQWLGQCLRSGRAGLTRRYFAGVTAIVDTPWDITVSGDLRFPHVPGTRTARVKLLNAYLSKVHVAAQADPFVGQTFLKAVNFLISPQQLMSPRMLWRVWRGRKAQPVAQTAPRDLTPVA